MDGIHDMGGRQGFGSLRERDEATFHAPWEKRVMAMANLLLMRGCYNVDAFRHAIERVEPAAYLGDGYYGRWLAGVEKLVAEDEPTPDRFTARSARRELDHPPRFRVGDPVRTRRLFPSGHCRLPGYARGCRGAIALHQGAWILPDSHAHGRGENPEHVYAVRFDGRELWGDSAEPSTCVHIDLFESYLEGA
jgi:nitrile hydratase